METVGRKPFQGITNILRFNWHFYAWAVALVILLHLARQFAAPAFHPVISITGLIVIITTLVSLLVSFYVYDLSGMYSFSWLHLALPPEANIINIHAGFDETSSLLANKFQQARLTVFDFYDAQKHTEVSIKRARKAYPAYPGTQTFDTDDVPLKPASVDVIFCILSAHEIRNSEERSRFFHQLRKGVKKDGRLVVVEHLRNLPNFFAYNIGFFHFHSAGEWKRTFAAAGLRIGEEQNITPFIKAYFLQTDGTSA